MLEYLGLLPRTLSSWYWESQKSNQKVKYRSVNVNWELTKSWKILMTSPLPIWGYNYPLIGVFVLVCVLINNLFALESISLLYSVSKQSFLGIFAPSFLSRLGRCEEGVRRQEDNKVFSPFSLLPLAFLQWLILLPGFHTPLWAQLQSTGWPQLLGSDNSSYFLSLLHKGKHKHGFLSFLLSELPRLSLFGFSACPSSNKCQC